MCCCCVHCASSIPFNHIFSRLGCTIPFLLQLLLSQLSSAARHKCTTTNIRTHPSFTHLGRHHITSFYKKDGVTLQGLRPYLQSFFRPASESERRGTKRRWRRVKILLPPRRLLLWLRYHTSLKSKLANF